MAGIYLHIPFCKQACTYCNFHFSTLRQYQMPLVNAMVVELDKRSDYLAKNETISSIYFGGGTPSLLSEAELELFLSKISQLFNIEKDAEITLEANPDDLDKQKLNALYRLGINRLSIGIQSFSDKDLKVLRRSHSAEQAKMSLETAFEVGFDNISIDLIYALPDSTVQTWQQNLLRAAAFPIAHLSAYCLTVEPKTQLHHQVKKKTIKLVPDEEAAAQMEFLMNFAPSLGFEQYEVSNFCRNAAYARHNTAYWQQKPYLGIGPAAHSYNIHSRQWNIANNALYIKALENDTPFFEIENLSPTDKYNEYIMTGLRTRWGIDRATVKSFGEEFKTYFETNSTVFLAQNMLQRKGNTFSLTRQGFLQADAIASALFWEKN
ncbi:MAG: radical SAM family heme chaperone HemW [Chitinophagales bacterium]|nr:radical SAM family heme chaperone HemW [Bacteroidota bacterium]